MGFIIQINNSIIINGTEFGSFYHNNRPNFKFDNLGNFLEPRSADQDHLTYSGYDLNVKSTIFADARPTEIVEGDGIVTASDTDCNIKQGYLEMEIVYYDYLLSGRNSYLFPTHELLKLFYWFSKVLANSEGKLRKIRQEALGKAKVLNDSNLASESKKSYEDLLNSTFDLYSELMFASICQIRGLDVTLNEVNDFVINGREAEVKAIHDDYNRTDFDENNRLLTKSLPNSYRIDDLYDEISDQLVRKKWCDHLSKAVCQKGKIVFVNATQSPALGRIAVFIEEHGFQRDIKKIIYKAMEFMDKNDLIPVIIAMEAIHIPYVLSSLLFLVPITLSNGSAEVDKKRYNRNYIKENIFL
jgi:hypothetical protein